VRRVENSVPIMMNETLEREYQEYNEKGRIWGEVPKERIKKIKFARIAPEIVSGFLELEDLTTTVSDLLDAQGVVGAVAASHVAPLLPGRRIVGTAVTLRNIPERRTTTQGYHGKSTHRMSTREIYYMSEPGDILVADFGGDRDISNFGGNSATIGKTVGFAGAVVFGAVRDVSTIRKLDYPVWAAGTTPITGKYRIEASEINGTVTVHGVTVEPGDLVIADDSGVCFVPPSLAAGVLRDACAKKRHEDEIVTMIRERRPLSELKKIY
jgi:4-hydroxy-4-methyl-2-oxoglutarate aldolase